MARHSYYEKTRKFTLEIPVELWNLLKEEAMRNERTMSQQIRVVLREKYMDKLSEE